MQLKAPSALTVPVVLCLAMLGALPSCIASYHTKRVDRPVPRDWVLTGRSETDARSGREILAFTPTEYARYQIRASGPSTQWSGYVGSQQIDGSDLQMLQFPAGPEDAVLIRNVAEGSATVLQVHRMAGESLSIKSRSGTTLSIDSRNGVYVATAYRQIRAEILNRTVKVVQRPTRAVRFSRFGENTGVYYGRGMLIFYQCFWWVLFPPFILADIFWPSIGLPSEFVALDYEEIESGVVDSPSGEFVQWSSPVAGLELEWALELSNQRKVFRGSIFTGADGSCVIPFAAHRDELLRDIDLGRSARLVVKEVASKQSQELTVDLIEILEGMSTANRVKSGRGGT